MQENIITKTDSYKVCHWNQYPKGTKYVYSYFESRPGAKFDKTLFFGLQYLLKKHLEGTVVTREKIDAAEALFKNHFGNTEYFNRAGWEYILKNHKGRLPVRIKAVAEGTLVPVSNVLMTIENTDPNCYWLTNYLETILSQVWYPCTVATLSRHTKEMIKEYLHFNSTSKDGLNFMLHDFGYRGASSDETAAIGGAAHLVNFMGTDTLAAMELASSFYEADLKSLAFSVAATEHSIMTASGPEGEEGVLAQLLEDYPKGILSVVSDSYDIYNFIDNLVGKKFRDQILARDGVFVVRPDSISPQHPTPEAQMVWIAESLFKSFGGTRNKKNYKVINPKIRMLWGDGIDIHGVDKILKALADADFATENVATFGMGGGLLQKVNRDTQRFAFKSSAQKGQDNVWHDVFKNPKDQSKASKKGRFKLVKTPHKFETVDITDPREDHLKTVFLDGRIIGHHSFEEIRARSNSNE